MKKICLVSLLILALLSITLHTGSASTVGYLDTKENRTFVPLRFISEALGAKVTWENSAQSITVEQNDKVILLKVGSKNTYINHSLSPIEVAPFIENGTTYVPLRFISEALGISPNWNAELSIVELQLKNKKIMIPLVHRMFEQKSSAPIQHFQQNFQVSGKTIKTNIVKVDLKRSNLSLDVVLAHDKIGSVQDLNSMATRKKATVAVNGTFFDAYTNGNYKQPYGFIYVGGKQLNHGDDRAVFWFDDENHAFIYPGPYFKEFIPNESVYGVLQAGPTLVRNGKIYLNPKGEGHSDPKILINGGARSAIGIDQNQNLLILTTNNATIPQLAEIMKQAGAYQAINLDGGASSGLYYSGKYITTPGRQISNALVVVQR